MRWDNLLADQDQQVAKLPLFSDAAVISRFDTPEFQGFTFYEVMAKSIINHVPGDRFGFSWTLNPYRGCSHACSYCLAGDTAILMADGRTLALAKVRRGDEVIGTERRGNHLRYVSARVLDHWSNVKESFRVTLADGTVLVASGDHRLLTDRGYKHVSGSMAGIVRRPHLTINNKLMGFGHVPESPAHTPDYRRGYLTGMIRGDGHLGAYAYNGPTRVDATVYRFRLALVDEEALSRSKCYLSLEGIETKLFQFAHEGPHRKPSLAIRTSRKGNYHAICEIIAWPERMTLDWRKGFLAGIYDAEGSFSRGILRICNKSGEIIDMIRSSLDSLQLPYAIEVRPADMRVVRILGGLSNCMRFFLETDPSITRKRVPLGMAVKNASDLRVLAVDPLGISLPMFDIATTTENFIANGVISHNCFARPTHTFLDFDAGADFEKKIVVKVNAVELLRRELRKPTWSGDRIAMGTNTDPYQRAEGRYRLMPGILSELNSARNPYSILTKGTLIQRDIDLLVEGASVTDVSAAFSVGTVDEKVWRSTEPGTPHPMKRLEVVKRLNDAGVPCSVLMAPILPGISDSPEQMENTVKAIAAAGAVSITPIVLHLRKGVKEEFMRWLRSEHPALVRPYEQMYPSSTAVKSVAKPIQIRGAALRRKYIGTAEKVPPIQPAVRDEPEQAPAQMSFEMPPVTKVAPRWVKEKVR